VISERITELLNEQLNKEFYSAYLYLSMANYFYKSGLHGFTNWCTIQSKEEAEHGMIIFEFLNNYDAAYKFKSIPAPDIDFKSTLEAMEAAYSHEKNVTSSINCIKSASDEFKDHITSMFMDWYIQEQFEEEHVLRSIINKLRFCVDNKIILMLLDNELSKRTYKQVEYKF